MDKLTELQNEAIEAATQHIRNQRSKYATTRVVAACLTTLLGISIVCAAVVACFTISKQYDTILEQQYALNMQYAALMEYVAGAEVTTTHEAEAGDNGTAIVGSDNVVAGGDVNGMG